MSTNLKSVAAALLIALLGAGCGDGAAPARPAAGAPATEAPAGIAAWFPLRIDGVALEAQIAIRIDEMQRGLMHRRDLGPDQGMIFLYQRPQALSFWMRNTPLPLDIGFFTSDGVLTEVVAMQPFDETAVRSARSDLRFALEMHQGWFRRQGLRPGARLDLGLLRAAIERRGYEPGDFLPPAP